MPGTLDDLSEALEAARGGLGGWTARGGRDELDAMETRGSGRHAHLRVVRAGERRTPDEAVQRALSLMRGELAARWTVTSLARRVALSRPAFARRFRESEGVSPMRRLAALRMEEAARLLEASDAGLAQVGQRVGYASEFAFNRAFKRHHGVAPGGYRRGAGTAFRAAA